MLFRQKDKEALLDRSNRYARAGIGTLLLALTLAAYFVLHVAHSSAAAAVVAVALIAAGGWLWLAVALWRRRSSEQESLPDR